MKIQKRVKVEDNKKKLPLIDFRNAKSIAWNNKRRFGI
jgi:hypothetical protein